MPTGAINSKGHDHSAWIWGQLTSSSTNLAKSPQLRSQALVGKLLLLFCSTDHDVPVKWLLNIYVCAHRLVLLSALVKGLSFHSG